MLKVEAATKVSNDGSLIQTLPVPVVLLHIVGAPNVVPNQETITEGTKTVSLVLVFLFPV